MRQSGIYLFINKNNSHCYIGKSINIQSRKYQHEHFISSNKILTQAIKKHGIESFIFSVLEEVLPNKQLLDIAEKWWINYFMFLGYSLGNTLYNFTSGGAGRSNYTHSEETKQKISLSSIGKPKSNETKQKMSAAKFGKKATQEAKNNMSAARTGITYEKNKKRSSPLYGKRKGMVHSEETKQKMSLAKRCKFSYNKTSQAK